MILETSKEHAIKTWNTRLENRGEPQKISEEGIRPLENQLPVKLDEKEGDIYF